MNPLRSVGARLSLALLAVVAGALAIVYVAVVPRLEQNLVEARISQLERSADNLRAAAPPLILDDFVFRHAGSVNARIVVLGFLVEPPNPVLKVEADSGADGTDLARDPTALRAAETGVTQRARVSRRGVDYAEVATPTLTGDVLLLSASLSDVLRNVDLVRRRLLIAGVLALGASLLVGYGGAWLFARRIRRLERAAERIASGRFDEPVEDRGGDELGELAAAFERMRGRLAGLERARREFIANASHELRTPLFSLAGFLELLDDEALDEPTRREFLATMRTQVERLTKLATDLLDLSRIDAGRVQVERERLDLGAIAQALCAEFEPVARSREHPLAVDADGGPVAAGDEQRTLQIGRILLENALLHTPAGTPVRVRAERADGRAQLVVEDEGPGISPGDAEHVFERFYRGDRTLASGSGLGLAIAQELAELMGGAVELAAAPNRTRFALVLPRADP